MTLNELSTRARQILRDENKTIYNEINIQNGINEAIGRVKQLIKPLKFMTELTDGGQSPVGLPEEYHHLLSLYSASRCFFTDEQFQQSTILMNEFEQKIYELKIDIESGDVVITDANGEEVSGTSNNAIDAIKDVYFVKHSDNDIDSVVM